MSERDEWVIPLRQARERSTSTKITLEAKTDVDLAYDEGYSQGYYEGRRAGVYEALDEMKDHVIRAIDRE